MSPVDFFKHNWFKLAILIILVLVSYYSFKYLEIKRSEENIKTQNESAEQHKQYVADRQQDCLAIYETERARDSYTKAWRYLEEIDECGITYQESYSFTVKECAEIRDDTIAFYTWNDPARDGEIVRAQANFFACVGGGFNIWY